MSDYNRFDNHKTWNVALWIVNDKRFYKQACDYVRWYPEPTYDGLAHLLNKRIGPATPDGVRWLDPTIDQGALDAWLAELLD